MKQKWFDLALKILQARKDDFVNSQHVTAILVLKKNVISVGNNSKKTSPLQKKFSKNQHAIYNHAEIDCIKNALRTYNLEQLNKSQMYIVRNSKSGKIGLAKPCSGCSKALSYFGIHKVFHT